MLCIFRPTVLSIRSTLCETSQLRMFIRATFSCPTWTCGRLFPSTMCFRVFLPIFSAMICSPASSPPLRSKSRLVLRFPTAFQSLFSKIPVDFRSVPRFPQSKPELIQCLKNQSCFLYREKKSTHVFISIFFLFFRTISTKSGFFRIVRFTTRWFRAGSTRSKSPT